MPSLTDIRTRIDAIDAQIRDLFLQRMDVAREVAESKRTTGKPVYDRARERENIARAAEAVPYELASYAATIEAVLMEASRDEQYRLLGRRSTASSEAMLALSRQEPMFPLQALVACQGVEGAYQQIASDRLFKRSQISYFDTFEGVFRAVEQGLCDYGVLPIENSTAGSVNQVFDLMMRHDCHIVRTCRLKVDHCLLARDGVRKEDIHDVYSHQQALSQCAAYLSALQGVRSHVCENTAMAAQMVAESDRDDIAAISSRACAQLYGLSILDQEIQDQANNYTRFACISKELKLFPGADRASFMMIVNHEPGALYEVLGRFYSLGINLLKLESRPIPGRNFEFMFYFDVECPATAPEFPALLNSLSDVCEELRFLGSYSEIV